MGQPYTGGCACGAIRYEIHGDPMAMVDCQCRQCQRESGTGHTSNLVFAATGVEVEGKATRWETAGDGGTVKSRAFCPNCGAPVYMTFPAMPDVFVVRAASLDEPTLYKPQMVTWTSAAQPWDLLDPATTKFERMPNG